MLFNPGGAVNLYQPAGILSEGNDIKRNSSLISHHFIDKGVLSEGGLLFLFKQ